MKLTLAILAAAALAFAAENETAPKATPVATPTDLPDSLKVKLAVAQRDFQAAKSTYDEKTTALGAAATEATAFCSKLGKQVDFNGVQCVAVPPPAAAKPKE